MMKIRIDIFLGLILVLSMVNMSQAQHVGIIPQPQSVVINTDSLKIDKSINVNVTNVSIMTGQYLRENLLELFQLVSYVNSEKSAMISFQKAKHVKSFANDESYELVINKHGVTITAIAEKGYFNGINSLLQLIYNYDQKGMIKIPYMIIKDSPLLTWRGFMLDESRHFFGATKVKQLLDWMAFYKLNKFHWHLTDEPAWRIEIKQYPFLTLVGGVGTYLDPLTKAVYYTQDEIKEVVAYAAARHIEVIPEIDMPGHATAANKAYPQFSGGGTKDHPDFTFHPAKEGTYAYLTNILKEVNVLFPSNMLHLGGDEVAYGSEAWNKDVSIQQLKEKFGYRSNKDVELHFMRRMADSVYNLGAKLVVWDEMVDAGLPKDKTIQYWWRHDKPAQLDACLKNGYATVICPRLPFYFDFVQAENHKFGRKWSKGYNPLASVYDFSVESLQVKELYKGQILGVQANLWTERIHNEDRLDFMVFPRIAALAEAAWTPTKRKDFGHFQGILKKHLNLYRADGIYFFDPFNDSNTEPKVQVSPKKYIDNPE